MAVLGPRPFPTKSQIIPTGTTGSVVISAVPAVLANVTNALAGASVAVSLNDAATTGAIASTNCFFNQQPLGNGQIYTFDRLCKAGIILTFASALTGNLDVTWTPLGGAA